MFLDMVYTRLRAKFRHRTTQRFGGVRQRQNKQTLSNTGTFVAYLSSIYSEFTVSHL